MFNKNSMDFLENLMNTHSPSGYEEIAAKCFREYITPFCDKCYTDVMGNTIGVINPDAPFKVMLAGHYDEIGFQVTYISDEGMIYFRPNGGIDKLNIPSSEVDILTDNGMVSGVIGKKPIHLLKPKERDCPVELSDMWIDIGAENAEEAQSLVAVGDPVAMRCNYSAIGKNRIKSKGMDDKIGAFVVAEVLRNLSKKNINVGVYAVGTVQEELGLRGAVTGAFQINPNVAFAVDVGFTTDIPDIQKKLIGDIRLGNGPKLAKSADNNVVLSRKIRDIAKKKKITYQESVGHRATGGTDTAVIQLTRNGVATALVSIPNRYMHSQVEMCDLRDVDGAIKLLSATIESFKGDETFIPGID